MNIRKFDSAKFLILGAIVRMIRNET